jgi:hypothetical protein
MAGSTLKNGTVIQNRGIKERYMHSKMKQGSGPLHSKKNGTGRQLKYNGLISYFVG